MKTKKLDVVQVCRQFEDVMAPRLHLSLIERAVYWHLFRHSRVEGRARLHFSMRWLGRNLRASLTPVRDAVRRLIELKVLRLIERSNLGHVVEVRLPHEVCTTEAPKPAADRGAKLWGMPRLKKVDFLGTRPLRQSIHARERGVCFYCLREIPRRARCLDHVVPQAKSRRNSYRNLVSCCMDCNSRKGAASAGDHLRRLLREGRLTPREFNGRQRALKALAAGNLRPVIPCGKGRTERGEKDGHRYSQGAACPRPRMELSKSNGFPAIGV